MEQDNNSIDGGGIELSNEVPLEAPAPEPPHKQRPKHLLAIVGTALAIVIILGLVAALTQKPAKKEAPKPVVPITINTQSLDNGTLNKITTQASGAATPKQQLTINPDTLFKQSVSVQGNLKAAQNVDVGGNIAVNGTSSLQGAVSMNSNLSVRGALSVGGAISAASMNVGSLAITTINVSGSLNFGGHLVPSGTQPAVRASTAAGGGTVTVVGNDTAGTVTINTGTGAPSAGELAIITFKTAFTGTPKVQITPINGVSAQLEYYATRSAGFFTIYTASAPAKDTTYVFDYLVTQ